MRIAARRPRIETVSPAIAKENGEAESNQDKPKFWRYPSEALDRYEEWLDANLPAMRAETINRDE